jgi:hypothetical protein
VGGNYAVKDSWRDVKEKRVVAGNWPAVTKGRIRPPPFLGTKPHILSKVLSDK